MSGGPAVPSYDAAGNVLSDNNGDGNKYLYNGDGQICAVETPAVDGINVMTGYVYDAEGQRVAKGTITSWSCNPATNGFSASLNETDYILDQAGHQLTEMDSQGSTGTMAWNHTNVWAGSQLVATYGAITDSNGQPYGALTFYLDDWLGTRRVQTDYAGVVERTCSSLPFGDQESCTPTPTEHLFTGKERDSESGNDYFGARYYASVVGRFLIPDPLNPVRSSQKVLAQFLDDPQNWNKYSYGLNNPIRYTDTSGNFTGKDHIAMEMTALKQLGYSDRAASIAAKADARMDNFHNMASGVPFLHHFVGTSENPQHGEQADHSDKATAEGAATEFINGKELQAAGQALGGNTTEALEALGQATHTAQDIVRHQFEPAGDHPLGEAKATDAETKAAVAATQQVEQDFEATTELMGHGMGMTDRQISDAINRVKAGPQQ